MDSSLTNDKLCNFIQIMALIILYSSKFSTIIKFHLLIIKSDNFYPQYN